MPLPQRIQGSTLVIFLLFIANSTSVALAPVTDIVSHRYVVCKLSRTSSLKTAPATGRDYKLLWHIPGSCIETTLVTNFSECMSQVSQRCRHRAQCK